MVGETTTAALHDHLREIAAANAERSAFTSDVDQAAAIELAVTVGSVIQARGWGWPAKLTPVLREVLGLMCFQLGPAAHVYRGAGEFVDASGNALKNRAEDEQAFMLHKIVGIALEHGEKWDGFVQADINRAMEIVIAREAGEQS